MVRILTGTLLMVGKGTFAPEEMKAILAAKERGRAGFLAPARGLFLQEVYYKYGREESAIIELDLKNGGVEG